MANMTTTKIIRSKTPGKFDIIENNDLIITTSFEDCVEYAKLAAQHRATVSEVLDWQDDGAQLGEMRAEFIMSWVNGGGLAEDAGAAWLMYGR